MWNSEKSKIFECNFVIFIRVRWSAWFLRTFEIWMGKNGWFLMFLNCLKIYKWLILRDSLELGFELDLRDFLKLCGNFEKFKLGCEWNRYPMFCAAGSILECKHTPISLVNQGFYNYFYGISLFFRGF